MKIKCLRSDNVGEYEDKEFKEFYVISGIRLETTIPKTPQNNRVTERMNKTLNKYARNMKIHSGLPKMFWIDTINTVAYLINRKPFVPLNGNLPEEA